MPTNDFLPFAIGVSANVDTQAAYAARTAIIANGQSSGVVPSVLLNKINRQPSVIANVVAQYICDQSGLDALDNGSPSTLLANLKTAIAAQIDAQSGNYAIDTGVANAYVVAINPPITAWPDGMTFRFRVTHTNTGASTVNAGPGAVALNNNVNSPLVANDLLTGTIVTATYVAALGNCVVNSVVASQALTKAQADLIYAPITSVGAAIQGAFKNLTASATGLSATDNFACDEIIVEDTSNNYKTLRAVSLTGSLASAGAGGLDVGSAAINTWYARFVIWNGTTAALLYSLSATAPTMPSGYTSKARTGWVRSDSSANKFPLAYVQSGKKVQYKVVAASNVPNFPLMSSGAQGNINTPTYASISTTAFAPPTASGIGVIMSSNASAAGAFVSANNVTGSFTSMATNPPLVVYPGNSGGSTAGMVYFETAATIFYASQGAGNALFTSGWEDNL